MVGYLSVVTASKCAIKVSKGMPSISVLISWQFSHKHLTDWHQSMKCTTQSTDTQNLPQLSGQDFSPASLPVLFFTLSALLCPQEADMYLLPSGFLLHLTNGDNQKEMEGQNSQVDVFNPVALS